MTSYTSSLYIVCVFFLITTWAVVLLRCWVRGRMMNAFGWDDSLMVLAQLLFTVLIALVLVSSDYGMGKHSYDLTLDVYMETFKYVYAVSTVYVFITMAVKFSAGLFLLRLVITRRYRYTIWACLIATFILSVIIAFIMVLGCRPLALLWDQSLIGTCVPEGVHKAANYAASGIAIVDDWVFALLPIPLVYNIQMARPLKLSITFLLGLGILTSIACVVRLVYIARIQPYDITYTYAEGQLWTIVEPGLGIITSSLATLRPLLKKFYDARFKSFQNTTSEENSAGTGSSNRSYLSPTELSACAKEGGDYQNLAGGSMGSIYSADTRSTKHPTVSTNIQAC